MEVGPPRGACPRLNGPTLRDEDARGNISTGSTALSTVVPTDPRVPAGTANRSGSARTFSLGSPRTAQLTLGMKF